MSYILEALRQAERERQQSQLPLLTTALPPPILRRWWIGLILSGLLLNAVLLTIILTRPNRLPNQAPASVTLAQAPKPSPIPATTLATPHLEATRQPAEPKPIPPAVTTRASSRKKPTAPMTELPSSVRAPAFQVKEPVSEPPPLLDVLSGNARRNIPAMKLDVHIHSGEAGQRFVVINGRRYREGERLEEGPTLEAITVSGATLRQGRQRFQLPVR